MDHAPDRNASDAATGQRRLEAEAASATALGGRARGRKVAPSAASMAEIANST